MMMLFKFCNCSWWVIVCVVLMFVLKMVWVKLCELMKVFVLMFIVVIVLVCLMIK